MKPVGAILILLGGLAVYLLYSRSQRKELSLIRDLSAALEQMAGELRWRLSPLPDAIHAVSERKISGKYFRSICEYLQGGNTLQAAWTQTFSALPPEISGIVLDMEWGGDLPRQEGMIRYVSERLRRLSERKQTELKQREKLCAAAALSAAGILVLILI